MNSTFCPESYDEYYSGSFKRKTTERETERERDMLFILTNVWGAAHSKHWSKNAFEFFGGMKNIKRKKKKEKRAKCVFRACTKMLVNGFYQQRDP